MNSESKNKTGQHGKPLFNDRAHKLFLTLIVLVAVVVPLSIEFGFVRVQYIEFLNGMAWQNKSKAQSESAFFPSGVTQQKPVAGTVPRGVGFYGFAKEEATLAGLSLVNPLALTRENLRRGQQVYDTYCMPCHGYKGMADGPAVGPGRLPAPLSLHTDQARGYSDGRIFHIITAGQNTMPGYARQISPKDRWAAVQYLRVLQRSMSPSIEDIAARQAPEENDGGAQ